MPGIQRIQPSVNAYAVTPHDTNNITLDGNGERVADSLYVGTGGDVVVVFSGGNTVTFSGVPSGTVLPVRAQRVNATGTTATNIVALFNA